MVQVVEQGDIFGKVGKAFGEGLGEAIPKAMERRQFAEDVSYLKELAKEKKLDPFTLSTAIPMVRGASEQDRVLLRQSLQDLMRRESYRKPGLVPPTTKEQYVGERKEPQVTPVTPEVTPVTPQVTPVVTEEKVVREITQPTKDITKLPPRERKTYAHTDAVTLTDPKIEALARQPLLSMDPDDIGLEATEKYPGLDLKEAEDLVKQDRESKNKEIQNAQNTKTYNDTVELNAKTKLRNNIQDINQEFKDDQYRSITGESLKFMENELIQRIKNGEAESEIIKDLLGRARKQADYKTIWQRLGTYDGIMGYLKGVGPSMQRTLVETANVYNDTGDLTNFEKDAQNHMGLSHQYVAGNIYDPSEGVEKVLNQAPKISTDISKEYYEKAIEKFGEPTRRRPYSRHELLDLESKDLAIKLADSFTKNDSIPATQKFIYDLGFDDTPFLQELQRRRASGEIDLQNWQSQDLDTVEKLKLSLGDIFFGSLLGHDFVRGGTFRKLGKMFSGGKKR